MVTRKNKQTLFSQKVWEVVCAIPKGRVLTYGEVARRAGFFGAARAVGTLMKKNFDDTRPCHRVICSDGTLGQYNRGAGSKERILRAEGVTVQGGRVKRGAGK